MLQNTLITDLNKIVRGRQDEVGDIMHVAAAARNRIQRYEEALEAIAAQEPAAEHGTLGKWCVGRAKTEIQTDDKKS